MPQARGEHGWEDARMGFILEGTGFKPDFVAIMGLKGHREPLLIIDHRMNILLVFPGANAEVNTFLILDRRKIVR